LNLTKSNQIKINEASCCSLNIKGATTKGSAPFLFLKLNQEAIMKIIQANIEHLEAVAKLFDDYRQFYKQETNLQGATEFLRHNINNSESIIFIAQHNNELIGFVQLYPTWESITMSKRWILYDLFVTPSARGKGVGQKLMQRAKHLAQETGAQFITLETAKDNLVGQSLYESEGYERDTEFYTYNLAL
jgi:ribosomal protein S18 acetylase RimI-like enzyme